MGTCEECFGAGAAEVRCIAVRVAKVCVGLRVGCCLTSYENVKSTAECRATI